MAVGQAGHVGQNAKRCPEETDANSSGGPIPPIQGPLASELEARNDRGKLRPESFAAVGVLGAAGCAVYAACYLTFSATTDERHMVQSVLSQGARRGWAALSRARKAETL